MEIQEALNIEFHCLECGSELDASFAQYDNERIDVGPCEKCLAEAKDEGHEEGYIRGLEEGKEESGDA